MSFSSTVHLHPHRMCLKRRRGVRRYEALRSALPITGSEDSSVEIASKTWNVDGARGIESTQLKADDMDKPADVVRLNEFRRLRKPADFISGAASVTTAFIAVDDEVALLSRRRSSATTACYGRSRPVAVGHQFSSR